MDKKRRDFLKIAGLSAIAGVAAPTALNTLFKGEVIASDHGGGHGAEPQGQGHAKIEVPTGKRFGMVIDVNKFHRYEGLAEKCTNACHSIHNVPKFTDPKVELKWIWKEPYEHAFTEHSHYKKNDELHNMPFMVMCNHCDAAPCVRVCPTQATFKNKDGIVLMDFHRCIGCRFCMAACPYGSRSFNWSDPRGKDKDGKPLIAKENTKFPTRTRGVVEKCNFCAERIAVGQEPACVEACGATKAMIFGDLNDAHSEISQVLKKQYTIQRKPALGTKPSVFYII
ncbi:MAG: 4Fe-4S dicluster domain-containing protein [Desulfobulbaceae bacterium]|nr:4Fe-4S dicluster domain-containing protein [Desulfobulbaceae bacterium]MCK5340287.1 4Fe-4S dicluster domain-containing protein [Desulfobulbaceae bacterium]